MLGEALKHAIRYASGATSGGEGTARSRHVHEIEARLHPSAMAVAPPDRVEADTPANVDAPRVGRPPASRATALTLIVLGGLGSVFGGLSMLFVRAGGQGGTGGDFFDGLDPLRGATRDACDRHSHLAPWPLGRWRRRAEPAEPSAA
jgi:hypothetical protein